MTTEVACYEVCRGENLIGYAIFFSGGWDAYRVDGADSLLCVGRNFLSAKAAAGAVQAGFDWRRGLNKAK